MTYNPEPVIAHVIGDLDAIADPIDRFQAVIDTEACFDSELRGVRMRIAQQLRAQGKTFREIGALMGGVSAQRAEQIAKGR